MSESVGLSGFQGLPLRGLSIADFDEDGDLDLVFSVNGTFPLLLRNDGGNQNNWLTIQLAGTSSNRSGIGTKVELKAGHLSQKSETYGGHGFLSQSPPLAHFGLGQHERVDMLRILWPGGVLQSETDQPAQGKTIVKELNRKGTSCPLLYAWDGRKIRFPNRLSGQQCLWVSTFPLVSTTFRIVTNMSNSIAADWLCERKTRHYLEQPARRGNFI